MLRLVIALTLAAPSTHASPVVRIDDTTTICPSSPNSRGVRTLCFSPLSLARTLTVRARSTPPTALAPNDGWVGCSLTNDDAYPFDPATELSGARVDLTPEGRYPYDATLNPAGTEVWFPGASGDGVVVVDRLTGAVRARITVGEYPVSVAFTADGTTALASARTGRDITRIDAASYAVLGTLTMPAQPGQLAVARGSQLVYVAEWYGPRLYELSADATALLRTTTIGDSLWQLVIAPDGTRIYVTDRDPALNLVRVVDPTTFTELTTVSLTGVDPWGLDITADGRKLVTTCEDSSSVHIIDTTTLGVTDIALDATADPRDVDILEATQRAYVTGGTAPGAESIYVIDLVADSLAGSFNTPCQSVNVIAVTGAPVAAAGACCDGAGGCTVGDRSSCADIYQGDGTDCASGCGACCNDGGGCLDAVLEACEDTFIGGTFCAATPDPCSAPVAGACCDGTGGCSVLEPGDCADQYQGDGTDCATACGACCDGAGSCTDTIASQCLDVFVGSTFCAASPDPCATPPTGACCDGIGGCNVVEPADCTTGTYQGNGTDCDASCGACCDAADCTDTLATTCNDDFVASTFCGATPDPCSLPTFGACCDGAGGCELLEPQSCVGDSTYQGNGTDCASACGACCDAVGNCTDTITDACDDVFLPSEFCAATPSPCAIGCIRSSLLSLGNSLRLVKAGAGRRDLAYSWTEPIDGAAEYHVNYVDPKTLIPSANRTPGPALDACTAAAPATTCIEPLGMDRADPDGVAFYQAVTACGPDGADEGPF